MTAQASLSGAAGSEADFYAELTRRNLGVVDAAAQEALRTATILVAGCGSIGGAAIEPLVRLGARCSCSPTPATTS